MAPHATTTLEELLISRERDRLFRLIARKVPQVAKKKKDGTKNGKDHRIDGLVAWPTTEEGRREWERDLEIAREEIRKSWRRTCRREGKPENTPLPAFHDPFAGGGAIPLEAQRLGLEAHASDLNPVAVLINKAMIEIPPKFAGRPPVHPDARREMGTTGWKGAAGLAEDVRRYGEWMREEAFKRIGHEYPSIEITAELGAERPDLRPYVGQRLTAIAWIWARTVKSPNPAASEVDVPLVSSFLLAGKAGSEVYVHPVKAVSGYHFEVRLGTPPHPESTISGTRASGRSATFTCILTGAPITGDYIKKEAQAGRMGARLMAIVAEGAKGRVYLPPLAHLEEATQRIVPGWRPAGDVPARLTGGTCYSYGLTTWGNLFTARQLLTLNTFSDLVTEVREKIRADAAQLDDNNGLSSPSEGGNSALSYAQGVNLYLGLAISRFADRNNALCSWDSGPTGTKSSTGGSARTASVRNLFARQAIPMTWDYAEANPFSDSGGSYASALLWIFPAVGGLNGKVPGFAEQMDAAGSGLPDGTIISTDPPYYDNIAYADLSDFFYVWLRRTLQPVFPGLFSTLSVPKEQELVATAYRHGGKAAAERFFLDGMTEAMRGLASGQIQRIRSQSITPSSKPSRRRKDWPPQAGKLS